jgi:DNA repair exonuclease SbcCD nuclease subunit
MEPFIITGDLQVKAWQQFSYTRKSGMNSRLYYCLKVFDIILQAALKRKIKKLVLNGDLFEDNGWIEIETYTGVYRKLEKLHDAGIETVINLGNHDIYAELAGRTLHNLEPLGRLAHVVEKPELIWPDVWCIPWMANPEKLKEAIAEAAVSRRGKILILHCGVQGARAGPASYLVRNPIKLVDVHPKDFTHVLLSDYHTRQKLAANVRYLGSPLQHTFGETHRPCIWVVSIRGVEKLYTNLPQFYRIQVKSIQDLKDRTKGHEHDYFSIQIPAESSLRPSAVEKVASVVGFRFSLDVRRQDDAGAVSESTLAFNPHRAIRQYVKRQNRGAKALQLGLKLYNGEV